MTAVDDMERHLRLEETSRNFEPEKEVFDAHRQ